MSKWRQLVLAAAVLLPLSACAVQENVKQLVGLDGDTQTNYSGPVYPATSKIAIAFQPDQVGRSCRVFAQSLVELPANMNGKEIEDLILAEAGTRGADQVLIGRSRQAKDDNGPNFLYYGPTSEYLCSEQCGGWKYGYSFWEEQGEWLSLGYGEWGKAGARFETPVVTQVIMLRCQ
ncbi:MAG: hypothetical protein PHI97_13265 [Desulfobulbus sp.]|nr:hypothetical protein [Desulfobulbus sp.]